MTQMERDGVGLSDCADRHFHVEICSIFGDLFFVDMAKERYLCRNSCNGIGAFTLCGHCQYSMYIRERDNWIAFR